MHFFAHFSHQVFLALIMRFIFAGPKVQSMAIPETEKTELTKKSSFTPIEVDFSVIKATQNDSSINGLFETLASTRPWLQQSKTNGLDKRSGPLPESLTYAVSIYLADIYLGSNDQHIEVALDTGSSDLWVVSSNATCGGLTNCKQDGTFDTNGSSTYESLGTEFKILYADKSTSEGTWSKDSFSFADSGNPTVPSLQFAVVSNTSAAQGILGIAKENEESSANKYHNLPEVLVDDGVIAKNSYSLFLNSADSSTGKIIFGGIDEEKYYGDLVALPIQNTGNFANDLTVQLNSVQLTGQDTFAVDSAFVLDSGTTVTLLPSPVFNYLKDATDGYPIPIPLGDVLLVDCKYQNSNDSLTYNFDGVSIVVPVSDLIEESQGFCFLFVVESNTYPILGDNFLRSAYVYYDLTDNEISLAQAKYTNSSNIVAA